MSIKKYASIKRLENIAEGKVAARVWRMINKGKKTKKQIKKAYDKMVKAYDDFHRIR